MTLTGQESSINPSTRQVSWWATHSSVIYSCRSCHHATGIYCPNTVATTKSTLSTPTIYHTVSAVTKTTIHHERFVRQPMTAATVAGLLTDRNTHARCRLPSPATKGLRDRRVQNTRDVGTGVKCNRLCDPQETKRCRGTRKRYKFTTHW